MKNTNLSLLRVKVQPNAKRFEIVSWDPSENELRLRLKNPAQKGRANRELQTELEKAWNTRVKIERGHASNRKTIQIELSETELRTLLQPTAQKN